MFILISKDTSQVKWCKNTQEMEQKQGAGPQANALIDITMIYPAVG
jgi:hypothetical protein